MNTVDYRFMEQFAKLPANERLDIYLQNLTQLQEEDRVDMSSLIEDCKHQIKKIKAEMRRSRMN